MKLETTDMAFLKIPSSPRLWARHERLVLEVFSLALERLRRRENLPIEEDDLSGLLALETRRANFDLNQEDRGLEFPPFWENPLQPSSEADLDRPKTRKRPDFTSCFRDPSAHQAEEAYLDYHVECKRLGEAPSKNWNLNLNYVKKGIQRFLDAKHAYGRRVSSGAMVGYVQSMSLKEILDEVNEYIRGRADYDVPAIHFPKDQFGANGIAKTLHPLVRLEVTPASFDLHHLWVDLRRDDL